MSIWTCVDRDHTSTYEKNRQNARGGGQRKRESKGRRRCGEERSNV